MATVAAPLLIDEYLRTFFRPDRDYVDGFLEERHLGEYPHSRLQFAFLVLLSALEKPLGIRVVPEQRIQTAATRLRIPDVCVTIGRSAERVFQIAPFLCIEILSPEDRFARVEQRLQEYLAMGVAFVWVVDPPTHRAWIYTTESKSEISDGMLRTVAPDLAISLDELFRLAES